MSESSLPNPQAQVVIGVALYMHADGVVRIGAAPGSPRKPDLNDVRTLAARALADAEMRMLVEAVTDSVTARQQTIADQMQEAARVQQGAQPPVAS